MRERNATLLTLWQEAQTYKRNLIIPNIQPQRVIYLAVDLESPSHGLFVEGLEGSVMRPAVVETRDVVFAGAFRSSHQRADTQHRDGGRYSAQPGHEHDEVGCLDGGGRNTI